MAILFFQQNARSAGTLINGENDDRSRVTDNVTAHADSGGLEDFIGGDPEHRASVGYAGREDASSGGRFSCGVGGFWHGTNIREKRRLRPGGRVGGVSGVGNAQASHIFSPTERVSSRNSAFFSRARH